MIERIESEAELRKLIEASIKGKNDLHFARISLSSANIQGWIDKGNFKRLKDEVNIYNNIRFGCLKSEGGCQYYFIGNLKAINRILNLVTAILADKPGHLKDFSPDEYWRYTSYYNDEETMRGQFNACPLF